MKEYTEEELKNKAESYCSEVERCPSDVEEKLRLWGAAADVSGHIVSHLLKERYLDATRYCRFFVRDKYRFNQWGRIKIAQALRLKKMSAEDIRIGLEEIDKEEYHRILEKLLRQKEKSIKAKTSYERNAKLIRFASGRGFTMDEIRQHIQSTEDEYME